MRYRDLKVVIVLLLLFPLEIFANESSEVYSYLVRVLPPFGRVKINNSIICPAPDTHSSTCLVSDQKAGSVMTITGIKNHACYIMIKPDGSVAADQERSFFCWLETVPASASAPGKIVLPQHF